MVTVNARGLSCPQPVLETRKAIQAGEFPIEVLVDTATSRDNVSRMARRAGLQVAIEDTADGFRVVLQR